MVDMVETGKRINAYIQINGYTRERLAQELGISNTSVYKWLRGVAIPSIDNLIILSMLFNCKIDDLVVISETGKSAIAAGAEY